jgi:hypothetical protein
MFRSSLTCGFASSAMAAVLGLAPSSCAAADRFARTDGEILVLAKAVNSDLYQSLQSFVCEEKIESFRANALSSTISRIDMVHAKLSFERGVEQYADILQNQQPRPSLASLPGAWSEGEFGTLLRQTQTLLISKQVGFESFTEWKGVPAAVFHFDVSESESPWDLTVSGKHYRIPFRTTLWIGVESGEILHLKESHSQSIRRSGFTKFAGEFPWSDSSLRDRLGSCLPPAGTPLSTKGSVSRNGTS